MGRVVTPTFRVEFPRAYSVVDGNRWEQFAWSGGRWDCKTSGRPTAASLARYVRELEDSTLPGGCNEHLGLTRVSHAQVIRQSTGETVAVYEPAMFEVAS